MGITYLGNTPTNIVNITRIFAFSTTTPLGAAGVYTSPTIDAINNKLILGLITSDQVGSFFIQHSDDGTNWYNQQGTTATPLAANGVALLQSNILLRYVRLQYTNGTTTQTTFKISVNLSPL